MLGEHTKPKLFSASTLHSCSPEEATRSPRHDRPSATAGPQRPFHIPRNRRNLSHPSLPTASRRLVHQWSPHQLGHLNDLTIEDVPTEPTLVRMARPTPGTSNPWPATRPPRRTPATADSGPPDTKPVTSTFFRRTTADRKEPALYYLLRRYDSVTLHLSRAAPPVAARDSPTQPPHEPRHLYAVSEQTETRASWSPEAVRVLAWTATKCPRSAETLGARRSSTAVPSSAARPEQQLPTPATMDSYRMPPWQSFAEKVPNFTLTAISCWMRWRSGRVGPSMSRRP